MSGDSVARLAHKIASQLHSMTYALYIGGEIRIVSRESLEQLTTDAWSLYRLIAKVEDTEIDGVVPSVGGGYEIH